MSHIINVNYDISPRVTQHVWTSVQEWYGFSDLRRFFFHSVFFFVIIDIHTVITLSKLHHNIVELYQITLCGTSRLLPYLPEHFGYYHIVDIILYISSWMICLQKSGLKIKIALNIWERTTYFVLHRKAFPREDTYAQSFVLFITWSMYTLLGIWLFFCFN